MLPLAFPKTEEDITMLDNKLVSNSYMHRHVGTRDIGLAPLTANNLQRIDFYPFQKDMLLLSMRSMRQNNTFYSAKGLMV